MIKIVKNAIKCNFCGDVIESTHVHDFKWYSCGKVAVDGGHDYLRRCGDLGSFTDLSEVIDDGTKEPTLDKKKK